MSTVANPILSGLGQAVQMAALIKQMKNNEEYVQLQKQRQAETEQYHQAELQTKLNELGARPMSPVDELELETGWKQIPGQPYAISRSTLKGRTVKAGGQQWVLPDEGERAAMEDRSHTRALKRKTDEMRALGDITTRAEVSKGKAKLAELGIEMTPEAAKLLKLPAGTRILPEHLDDYNRAIGTAMATEAQGKKKLLHAWLTGDADSQSVAMVDQDGKLEVRPLPGVGPKATAATTSRGGSSRSTTAADTERARKQLVSTVAGNIWSQSGGDANKAQELLAEASKKTKFIADNASQIARELKGSTKAQKPISQMTPEELQDFLAADANPNTEPPPGAAKPQPAGGGSKAADDYIQKLAKKKR